MVAPNLENVMPTVCESCGRLNRTQAMFCNGCLHQLPAFAPSGPSALASLKRRATESSDRDNAARLARARSVAELRFPMWLPALLLALCVAFIGWYAMVSISRTGSSTPMPTHVAEAASDVARISEARASTPPAQSPLLNAAQNGGPEGAPLQAHPSNSAAPPEESGPSRTVAAFYRALSKGDGHTAVAEVTPAKRGTGAFRVEGMSRFFGSLREPLVVESIEMVAPNRVLARYAYRASRAWCRTTATIETEAIGQETFIRSIRARC